MIAATIFLVCFVIIGGVVMYLSQTIEHGEARFDQDGKVITDKSGSARDSTQEHAQKHTPKHTGPAKPAQRIGTNQTTNSIGTKDDE